MSGTSDPVSKVVPRVKTNHRATLRANQVTLGNTDRPAVPGCLADNLIGRVNILRMMCFDRVNDSMRLVLNFTHVVCKSR